MIASISKPSIWVNVELARVREGEATAKMQSLLEVSEPAIDWV